MHWVLLQTIFCLHTGPALGFLCNQIPRPVIHGEDAEGIALDGCSQDNVDLLELLYDIREGLAESRANGETNKQAKWQKTYRHFEQTLQGQGSQFALDEYRPLVATYLQKASVHGGPLAPEDEETMKRLGYATTCESPFVGCEGIDGETHVVSLAHSMRSAKDWVTLSGLRHLRALSLIVKPAGHPDKMELPELEAIEVSFWTTSKLFMEHFLEKVVGKFTKLRVLSIFPGKYKEFNFNLQTLCGLTELRDLFLTDMNIHEIPGCFSKFTELRNVYMSCNYLKEAPRAFAGLPELRSFIAFRQGEWTPCHFSTGKQPKLLKDLHMDRDCKLTWETKSGLDGDDNPRVLCRPYAIQGTVQDFMDLGWKKLEKLWLDGNFISGNIPEDLPQAWPNLSSLDLYNNNLTGEVPKSLSDLPFVKLQLHDNRLSGKLPQNLLKLPACTLNFAANEELEGCVPKHLVIQRRRRVSRPLPGWEGTRTTTCQKDGRSADIDEL